MMKSARIWCNVLLGTVIALLTGCHSQKQVKQSQEPSEQEPKERFAPREQVICLYGIPPEVYKQLNPEEISSEEKPRTEKDKSTK